MNWRGGTEAGADGGSAEVDDAESFAAFVDSPAIASDGFGVGAHLATEGDEDGVLQLGAADFDDVGEFVLFTLKGFEEGYSRLLESIEGGEGGDFQGGGEGVVGRLMEIEVIVGADGVVVAEWSIE